MKGSLAFVIMVMLCKTTDCTTEEVEITTMLSYGKITYFDITAMSLGSRREIGVYGNLTRTWVLLATEPYRNWFVNFQHFQLPNKYSTLTMIFTQQSSEQHDDSQTFVSVIGYGEQPDYFYSNESPENSDLVNSNLTIVLDIRQNNNATKYVKMFRFHLVATAFRSISDCNNNEYKCLTSEVDICADVTTRNDGVYNCLDHRDEEYKPRYGLSNTVYIILILVIGGGAVLFLCGMAHCLYRSCTTKPWRYDSDNIGRATIPSAVWNSGNMNTVPVGPPSYEVQSVHYSPSLPDSEPPPKYER